ncbi:hypothetical protein Tco_0744159 [Tanacetum coccineum]
MATVSVVVASKELVASFSVSYSYWHTSSAKPSVLADSIKSVNSNGMEQSVKLGQPPHGQSRPTASQASSLINRRPKQSLQKQTAGSSLGNVPRFDSSNMVKQRILHQRRIIPWTLRDPSGVKLEYGYSVLGKHVRLPFSLSETVVKPPFDIIHSDL